MLSVNFLLSPAETQVLRPNERESVFYHSSASVHAANDHACDELVLQLLGFEVRQNNTQPPLT